jgi:nucleoside-diphosphate-sugar epimerase
MHVFVTGGTGTIGAPVVAELLAHNHTVSVLARSDRSAALVEAAGATPVHGSLRELDILREQASAADGVIHLAFGNDFSSAEALAADIADEAAAMRVLGEALVGTGKPIVTASGTPAVAGRASTEHDELSAAGPVAGRFESARALFALADRGVRVTSVRLPRTVHRDGTGGFAGLLTQRARTTGVVAYPGDGTQRWPAVHALDAAVLFRLALENAPAGTAWHAVADEGVPVRSIAEVIAARLDLPIEQQPADAFGTLGGVFTVDQPSSSAHTRSALNWTPTHPPLLDDLATIRP